MNFNKSVLITGGAGFIGSHTVKFMVTNHPDYQIVVLDKLTYAGNLDNLDSLALNSKFKISNSKLVDVEVLNSQKFPNVVFVQGDICDAQIIQLIFETFDIDSVMHLAAESHVDRSIENPMEFVSTNVVGTVTLLNVALKAWGEHADRDKHLFYHISTDEVYGSLGAEGLFTESTAYDPRSPYSASKAASDHFVRAYYHTYGMPVVISNCSNNYGPNQYPEKLIPVVIRKIMEGKPIPVYGKGENIRDWLFVGDHVSAMDAIFHRGESGETYNVGGNNEWQNIQLIKKICVIVAELTGRDITEVEALIRFVTDRKGHDLRYAIDATKLKIELGWEPKQNFDYNLTETVRFYLNYLNENEK